MEVLQTHWYYEVITWMRIDWIDLPKLTTLTTSGYYSSTFCNPHHIVLESDSHPLWMMLRHAQSHLCVSLFNICVRLQGQDGHNHRKYSLHPSLTNRHWSSCKSQESAIVARDSSLCATHPQHPSHPPQSSFSGIGESVIVVRTRKYG